MCSVVLWVIKFHKSRFSTCCIALVLCLVRCCSCYISAQHHSTTSGGLLGSKSWNFKQPLRILWLLGATANQPCGSDRPDSIRWRTWFGRGGAGVRDWGKDVWTASPLFKNCLYQPQTTSSPQQPHNRYPHRSQQTQTHHPTKWKQLLAKLLHLLQYFTQKKKLCNTHTHTHRESSWMCVSLHI